MGKEKYDLIEMAWVIIANVRQGDWTKETKDWQKSAKKWRDEYHKHLKRTKKMGKPGELPFQP